MILQKFRFKYCLWIAAISVLQQHLSQDILYFILLLIALIVKIDQKFSSVCEKMSQNRRGGGGLTHSVGLRPQQKPTFLLVMCQPGSIHPDLGLVGRLIRSIVSIIF